MKKLAKMKSAERLKVLKRVADEIQKVGDFDPPINSETKEDAIKGELETAAQELRPKELYENTEEGYDQLSEETTSVLKQLGFFPEKVEEEESEEDEEQEEEGEAEEVEEDEDDEEQEEDDEEDASAEDDESEIKQYDIEGEINEAESLKDLKHICKSYSVFKSLSGKLSKFKTKQHFDDLKVTMERALGMALNGEEFDSEEVGEPVEPEETGKKELSNKEKAKQEKKAKTKSKSKDSGKSKSKGKSEGKGKSSEGLKKVGVVATIVEIIEKAGDKGVTKEEIMEKLTAKFPDRDAGSMKNTVSVQVPNRISKEKFELEKTEKGKFKKKK